MHGFRGDHHGLEAIAAGLPNYEVFIPDLPGYGKTPPLEREHDLAGYARWLIKLNSELRCQIVAGHSFGSLVVAQAGNALNAEGLVLINPVASRSIDSKSPSNRLARAYYRLSAGAGGSVLLRNQLAVRAMSMALITTKDARLRLWIHQEHHRHFSNFVSDRVAVEGFWAAAQNSVTELAAKISTPSLIIAADRDQISSPREVSSLHQLLPESELVILTRVGHLLHYERPTEVAALIAGFSADLVAKLARNG